MKSKNYSRFEKVYSFLANNKVEGCIIDNPQDLFYLTGLKLSLGRLAICKKKALLFVDGRYFQICQEKAPCPTARLSEEALSEFMQGCNAIAFDSGFTTFSNYEGLRKIFPHLLKPIPHLLKTIRAIKDEREVKALKKSAALLWRAFLFIKKKLKEGVSEEKIAREFKIFCLQNRAEEMAFDPIIAFGKNSAFPHYHPGNTKLKKGDLVLVDIGVVLDSYASDMTRVVHFGSISLQLAEMEKIVRRAHKAALSKCKPGIALKELDLAARKEMAQHQVESLFIHSLGHGIGIETHEFPRIKYEGEDKDIVLEEGMVITVEPGLYLPGVGGIRHEDTIVITKKGYENFYA